MEDKQEVRLKYKKKRQALSEEKIEELSLEIANKALKLPIWDKTYYHIFLPITEQKELNTEFLMHILQGKDKSIVIPKTNFNESTLTNILLQENTVIKKTEQNIPEPVDGIEIPTNKIEIVFVPLLAFDLMGNRVGYGKGFYDRFLKDCTPETLFIGLSIFEAEQQLFYESRDIPLHFCITPNKIYTF